MWRVAGLAGGLVLASATCAAPAGQVAGADCLSIQDESARLACFDSAVGNAVRAADATAPAQTPAAAQAAAAEPAATQPGTAETLAAEPAAGEAPGPAPATPEPSMIDSAWGFLPDSQKAYVRLYNPNYLLLGHYTNNVNRGPYEPLFEQFAEDYDFEDLEAAFQISFKARLLTTDDRRWGLWFAYTQQSQWQIYSPDISRPFRETNYMPEVFGSFRPGMHLGDWAFNVLNFGYNHQSNGRADPISRSWDRVFIEGGFEKDDFALILRAWTRLKTPDYEDDNPDIMDYMGHAQATALYRWHGNSFALMARGNVTTGKGAAQFSWTSRPLLGPLRGYVQLFSGYGETLIDYDWNQTTIGIGVALNDQL